MATYPGQVVGPSLPSLSIGAVFARAFGAIGARPLAFAGVAAVLIAGPSLLFRYFAAGLFTPEHLAELPYYWPDFLAGGLAWWAAYLLAQTLFFLLTARAGGAETGSLLGRAFAVLPLVFIQSILLTLALTFATILFIIPGVILWLLCGVAAPSLTLERSGLFGSWGRSQALTAGSRFHMVAILFLVFAIYFVASGVLSVVSLALTGFAGAAAQSGPAYWAVSVLSVVLQMAFAAVWSAIKAALFLELRELKDGPAGERLAGIFA